MEINLLAIIVLIVILYKISTGYKRGMVKELVSIITLILVCLVLGVIAYGVRGYFQGELVSVVVSLVFVALLSVAHHFLNIILFPAKLLAKLPIIKFVDKLLGVVFGVAEVVVVMWAVYTLLVFFDLGTIEHKIAEYTAESQSLTWIKQNNYLILWVNQLISKLGV